MGDAGEEALKQAEQHLEEAENLLQSKKRERDAEVQRFAEYQEIWNLQQEKESYLQKEAELLKKKEQIREKESRLHLAETANTLKPYADAFLAAREDTERALREEKQAQEQLEQYEELHKKQSANTRISGFIKMKKNRSFSSKKNSSPL